MNLNLIIFIIIIVIAIHLFCNTNTNTNTKITEKFISCGNTGDCSSQLCSSDCKILLSEKGKNQCICLPLSPTPPPS